MASLPLFVSLVLTDSSQCGGQQQWLGQLSPGSGQAAPFPLCLHDCSWGSAGQRLREAAGEEGSAGWWERNQRPLLARRQTITPCLSKRGGQASPSFLSHVLAYQSACCPVTTDSLLPGCIFTSSHLVKKKKKKKEKKGSRFMVKGTPCILPWIGLEG